MTSRLWNILQSFTAIQQSHFKGIQILNHRRKKNYIKTGVHKPTMKGNIGKTLEKNALFKILLKLMVGV